MNELYFYNHYYKVLHVLQMPDTLWQLVGYLFATYHSDEAY